MNRINQLFQNKKNNILNIYFTAGYPTLQSTEAIILELEKSGADLIELGMPYSDPLADGPTIQESGQIAIANGMTLNILFDQVKSVRQKSQIPLVMMGYFNQVMQYGETAFFRKCAEVGIDGLILPDLPIDVYESDFKDLLDEIGLTISFLITPQTDEDRIRKVDNLSTGFIYVVSRSAITGAKSEIENQQVEYFNRVNALGLKTPKLIGFGISSHDTFKTACQHANGAIIGSAFIKALPLNGDPKPVISSFVKGVLGGVESGV
jgi:tryptophan synthase alpha chain